MSIVHRVHTWRRPISSPQAWRTPQERHIPYRTAGLLAEKLMVSPIAGRSTWRTCTLRLDSPEVRVGFHRLRRATMPSNAVSPRSWSAP